MFNQVFKWFSVVLSLALFLSSYAGLDLYHLNKVYKFTVVFIEKSVEKNWYNVYLMQD